MKKINTKYVAAIAAVTAVSGLVAATAMAQTPTTNPPATGSAWQGRGGMGMMYGTRPGVVGSVTAINGTTLTLQSMSFGQRPVANSSTPAPTPSPTTYTVNASNATIIKNNATSSIGSVVVGDRVFVQGTVTGNSVVATTIRDGLTMMRGGKPGTPGAHGQEQTTVPGNGQPVVAGTVSTVNGTSITITTSSNTSYTIDASSATVTKAGAASTVSAVAAGDYVVVQGAVNGSAVTAHSVMDQPPHASTSSSETGTKPASHPGFFGSIGQFFKNLFGF